MASFSLKKISTIFSLGDLGGFLGLFLGASALSVVEIVDWFLYKAVQARPETHDQKTGRLASQRKRPKKDRKRSQNGSIRRRVSIPVRYRPKPVPEFPVGLFPQYGFPKDITGGYEDYQQTSMKRTPSVGPSEESDYSTNSEKKQDFFRGSAARPRRIDRGKIYRS